MLAGMRSGIVSGGLAVILLLAAIGQPLADSTASPATLNVSLRPMQPLQVTVNPELLAGLGDPGYAVLLNHYDVTAFASASGNMLQITLDYTLEQGDYLLQINRSNALTPASTVFEQRLRVSPVVTRVSGEIRGSVFHRAAQSDRADFIGSVRTLSDAALRLQAERLNHAGSISLAADIQYRSDSSQVVDGDKITLPNYLLQAKRNLGEGQASFTAGHQEFDWQQGGAQGLVLDQFRRRGISLSLQSSDESNGVSVFASSSEPLISLNQSVLIPRNRSDRSAGAILRFSPLLESPERLQFSATYLDGQSVLRGTGIDYTTGLFNLRERVYGGTSSSLAVSSTWMSGAVRLVAEKAISDFDADGLANGEGARKDSASNVQLAASSAGNWAIDEPTLLGLRQWSMRLRRQIIGPDYYSMGNLSLPGDLDTLEAGFDASGAAWQFQSAWISATNNVDNRNTLPTQKVTERSASLLFLPAQASNQSNPQIGLSRWLGRPSLGLRLASSDRFQPLEDALLTGQELDDETFEYALTLDLVKPNSQWRVEYSEVDYDNLASLEVLGNTLLFAPISDSRNRFLTLQFTAMPSENFTVSPLLQWSRFNEKDTATSAQLLNYGLQSSVRWLEGRASTELNYTNTTQKSTTAFNGDAAQRFGNSQLDILTTWRAWTPKPNRPGIDFSLRATWNVNRSNQQRNNARYQVLLGFQFHWQARR